MSDDMKAEAVLELLVLTWVAVGMKSSHVEIVLARAKSIPAERRKQLLDAYRATVPE